MSQHSERHLQNIASSRERPVTPILDGGWVSKAALMSSDTWKIMKVCVTKMRKMTETTEMTEALTLSVCENVQCQHRPCQRPNILKVLKVFRRCASRQIDTSPLYCHENSGILHWWTGGRLRFRCGGERKAEHPSANSFTSIAALDKSSVQWTQRSLSLAAGIAAKYVCYILMSVATMRVI